MTAPQHEKSGNRRRSWLGWGLSLTLAAALAALGWWWWRVPTPVLPDLLLDEVQPRVAQVIEVEADRVRSNPRSAEAWGRLGKVLLGNGQNERAFECFEHAARLDSREPRWPYYQAIYLANRDTPRAEQLLRRAVALSERIAPDNLAPRLRLVELLAAGGKLEEAEKELAPAAARQPGEARVQFLQGLLAFHREQWKEALTLFLPLRQHPVGGRLVAGHLAMIYQRLHEPETAAEYSRVVARLVQDEESWSDDYLQECTSLNVRQQRQLREVAYAEKLLGPQEAMASVQELFRQSGGRDPLAYHVLGENLMKQGRYTDAARAFRRSLELAPGSALTLHQLSMALAAEGERLREANQPAQARPLFEEAAEMARQALASKSQEAWVQFQWGRCLLALGRPQDALEPLQLAVAGRPEVARFHCALAEAQAELGKKEEARRSLQRAFKIAGNDEPTVRAIRDRLRKYLDDNS